MTTAKPPIPRLALTLGEPAGIGPDVCLKALQENLHAEMIVIGSPDLLLERAKLLSLSIDIYEWDPSASAKPNGNGRVAIVPISLHAPCQAGILNAANSSYVIETLKKAHALCISKQCDALVTGPVQKSIIHESGVDFKGHTEFLAELSNVKDVLMTFATPDFFLAQTTTHVPLNKVSDLITEHRLTKVIELLHEGLKKLLNKASPHILVCGLNPHAGEGGLLGSQEKDIIIPTLEKLRQKGYRLEGPLPADTAFAPHHRTDADAIVAMYHDQGLAPIKALYFEQIVNVTLGLPYLRTSVDHGTALSLAGTHKASHTSLLKAIEFAQKGSNFNA